MKHAPGHADRSSSAGLAAFVLLIAACSERAGSQSAESEPAEVRSIAQPLAVTDPSVALALLLPEPIDPAFEGLDVPADAPTKGMWSPVFDWPLNGLHSVLLPTGKVLTYGTPSGAAATQDGRTFDIWSPETGFGDESHRTDFDSQRANSFCSSAAFNAEGSLLITGGNSPLESSVFSTADETVEKSPFLLASERWYGSMITLADGRFLMLGGSGPYAALRAYQDPAAAIAAGSVAMTPEVYEPATGFRSLFGAYSREAFGPDHHRYWYPRAWVAPDGAVFGISSEQMWRLDTAGDGAITSLGSFKTGVNATTRPNIGPTSTAAMFAPGRILQVGGNGYHDGHSTPSSALATVIDITGDEPVVTETTPMQHPRQWANLTLLPEGKVVVTGGTRFANNGGTNAVYAAELWDPETGEWTEGASASVIRVYHSAALLLPNGTVLATGGGAPGPVNNLNAEIYYPPSLFRARGGGAELAPRSRPIAVSTLAADYGEVINVDLSGTPSVEKAVLLGTSSVTHSFNTSQRRIELPFLQEASRVAVELPESGRSAPPGYYHLFFLDQASVPSRSVVIALGASMAAPPVPVALPRGLELTFESLNLSGHALAVDEEQLGILRALGPDLSEAALRTTRFIVRDGLSRASCVSLESVAVPGQWLHPVDDRLRVDANDDTAQFARDATFCPEHGLGGTGVTLRSERQSTRVIRHRGLELWLDAEQAADDFRADATFVVHSESIPEISVEAPILQAGESAVYTPAPPLSGATFSWDFGDGSAPTAERTSPTVKHRFPVAGLYLVTLTVRLSDGRRVRTSFIQAVGPALVAGDPQTSSLLATSGGTEEDRLWVVNPDHDSVTVFDTDALEKIAEAAEGG
ncbi:MAG TPA: AbfB domain-containing protein, partial [Polyangiaceae bacterium]